MKETIKKTMRKYGKASKVAEKRPGNFKITWAPSHTDLSETKELQARGRPKESMLIGNHWADQEAKMGMQFQNIDW